VRGALPHFRLFDLTLLWLQTDIARRPDFYPLPKGEGQGEGERDVRQPAAADHSLHSVGAWIYHFVFMVRAHRLLGHPGCALQPRILRTRNLLFDAPRSCPRRCLGSTTGKRRQSMVAYYLMQISAVACFAALRRHLMLTTNFWTYEYDVWASLAFSLRAGPAQNRSSTSQPRSLRVPLLTTRSRCPRRPSSGCSSTASASNMALLVVGLHSVLFAYLGRESREIALQHSGTVRIRRVYLDGFLFEAPSARHSRLRHSGWPWLLVLQEIFRDRIKPDARNSIRLVTLMAMLGSAGYYALVDPRLSYHLQPHHDSPLASSAWASAVFCAFAFTSR